MSSQQVTHPRAENRAYHQELRARQEAQLAASRAASTPEPTNATSAMEDESIPSIAPETHQASIPERTDLSSSALQTNSPAAASVSNSTTKQPSAATPVMEPPAEELPICWICQQDASEDTPETSVWRRPCPCSLTAHDECLMEWIKSQEAPKPEEIASTKQIVCPVCKAPIKLDRRTDYIVMLADLVQRVAKGLMIPAALSAIVGTIVSGLFVYGFNTMHIFFGSAEAMRMMQPSHQDIYLVQRIRNSRLLGTFLKSTTFLDPFIPTTPMPTLLFGLPLIAPGLILARTEVADNFFTILPISYFAFHPTRRLDLNSWPPSPALALATLPYLRKIYNGVYTHMFSDLEKQWDAAVLRKPGPGETAEQVAEEQEPARFGIEVELVDEELEQEILAGQGEVDQIEPDLDELAAGVDRLGANVANLREQLQQAQGDEAAREAMRQAHREAQAAVRRRGAARRVLDIQHNLTYTKVIGALFFPTISSVMGRLLLYTMPSSWTSKLGSKVSNGLLKETWGRNLIGGCLFVVLKDAVTLYCKWRKARDFSTLKILDYVGERRQA